MKTIIQGFFYAITNAPKSVAFIFQKKLWPYLIYPLILWGIMLLAGMWFFSAIADSVANYFNEHINFNNIPDSGSWLSFAKPFLTSYFTVFLAWTLKLIFWFITSTFSKYLTLICLSPLFSLLSEATEEILTQQKFPFSITQLAKDIIRGIIINIRNMMLEYGIIIICSVLTLIFPPLLIITGPLLLLVSWYFIGFTMLDYSFERHKMTIKESSVFTKQNLGLTFGIGAIYSVLMLLPYFLGLMFAPAVAVVTATVSYIELKQKQITA